MLLHSSVAKLHCREHRSQVCTGDIIKQATSMTLRHAEQVDQSIFTGVF